MRILALLKQQTQPFHEAVQAQLHIEEHCRSLVAYRRLLSYFYGFYQPVEAVLARMPALDTPDLQLAQRWKTPLLARDLHALQLTTADLTRLPRCNTLPDLAGPAAALGCLYVLEGATLGGQIAARQVAQLLGLPAEGGRAFFTSYGPQVGPMWRAFGAAVDAAITTEAQAEDAVTAACTTFETLLGWMQKNEVTLHL